MYLLGLLGLLLPIAIHLWSQSATQVRQVGSIRWMQSTHTPKAYAIQLHQWPLLVLRALLLSLICLLMADWVFQNAGSPRQTAQKWLLVDPALAAEALPSEELQKWSDKGYSLHYFQAGLPTLDLGKPLPLGLSARKGPVNFWSVLKNLDQKGRIPDSLVVMAYGRMQNFLGDRPSLSFRVQWILFPDSLSDRRELQAISLPGDSLLVMQGEFNEAISMIAWQSLAKQEVKAEETSLLAPGMLQDSIVVSLWASADFQTDLTVLSAALRAVSEYTRVPIAVYLALENEIALDTLQKEANWHFIFPGTLNPRDMGKLTGSKLVYQADRKNKKWFSPVLSDTVFDYYINHRLRTDSLLEPQSLDALPEELVYILLSNDSLSSKLASLDRRRIAIGQLANKQGEEKLLRNKEEEAQKAASSGWYLVLLLLALERIISHYAYGHK